jgi:hypothetical protein
MIDSFYIIVVVVAVIFLILCLVAVGISLEKKSTTDPFPKLQASCPDGWAIDGSGCTVAEINHGNLSKNSGGTYYESANTTVWLPNTSNTFYGNITASICDKRKWAISNGIAWDGISNYNQCA